MSRTARERSHPTQRHLQNELGIRAFSKTSKNPFAPNSQEDQNINNKQKFKIFGPKLYSRNGEFVSPLCMPTTYTDFDGTEIEAELTTSKMVIYSSCYSKKSTLILDLSSTRTKDLTPRINSLVVSLVSKSRLLLPFSNQELMSQFIQSKPFKTSKDRYCKK